MDRGTPYRMKTAHVTPDNCDREPVHIPGCIQPHGVLLVVRLADFGILQVSDNSADWLGQAPRELLGRPVHDVIGALNADCLKAVLAQENLENNPRYVFSFAPKSALQDDALFDVTAHLSQGALVLEVERTGRTENNPPDYYGLVKGTVARLQAAPDVRAFCEAIAEEMRKLTGLDRVMIYRFAEDHSGWVFAETRRDDLESFLDLHYPAEDIPKPAREIFTKITLRSLPDARHVPAEMVPLVNPDTGAPLNMTYCFLRGASKMYTDYLENMRVRMSLTMSILRDGHLWGMIACHHYEPKVIPYQIRAACEFLAQVVSLQLKSVEEREHAAYKDRLQASYDALLTRALPQGADFSTFVTGWPNLLNFISAGSATLYQNGKRWSLGVVPSAVEEDELVAWLRSRPRQSTGSTPELTDAQVFCTHTLSAIYPPASAYKAVASGLLAIPISRGLQDWLLWFRPEVEQTVTWAGDPNDKPIVDGPHGPRLMPRTSFAMWKETVLDQSLPWLPIEIEAARKLRLAMLEIIVGHAEELGRVNRQLEASNEELDRFAYVASHDLKEPLRGIAHYAQYLIDACRDKLDPDSQSRLVSLMRLTRRMDTLIDSLLHYSRVGRLELTLIDTDLDALLDEAFDLLAVSRKDAQVEFRKPRPLPSVRCDPVRVRDLLVNLIANAIKYNDSAKRWVEVGYREEAALKIFYVKDNGIGIDKKFHEQVFKMFKRLHGREEYGGGAGAGLSICRKIVERQGGRIWIESAPGEGTTFSFTLSAGGAA